MRRSLLVVFVLALAVVACGPVTPTPAPTPPTTVPTVAPTVNFKATESLIIAHVFATMTAVAPPPPTSAPVVVVPATATRRPTARPTTAAATKATATPIRPAGPPGPTSDPWLAQIPKGSGAILFINYVGNRSADITIASLNIKQTVDPNGKYLLVLPPGQYVVTVQIAATPGGSSNQVMNVVADRYILYNIIAPE